MYSSRCNITNIVDLSVHNLTRRALLKWLFWLAAMAVAVLEGNLFFNDKKFCGRLFVLIYFVKGSPGILHPRDA